jgi:ketosteroid isomerase-like protein
MASANLDLVRSILAPWESGDYRSTDWLDPDIDFVIADGPEPDSWTGLVGAEEGFREVLSAWQEVRVEADEYCELDDERVMVFLQRSGRGRTSGLEIGRLRTQGAILFHMRDGKVTRLVFYWDSEGARTNLWRESYEGWARDS